MGMSRHTVRLKTLGVDVATLERKCQVAEADARRAEEARAAASAGSVALEADSARPSHPPWSTDFWKAAERHSRFERATSRRSTNLARDWERGGGILFAPGARRIPPPLSQSRARQAAQQAKK